MKSFFLSSVVAPLLLVVSISPPAAFCAEIECFFSPRGGAAQAVCRRLDQTETSIDVAAFQLTYRPYIDSLCRARDRGVAVRVIVDPSQQAYKCRQLLRLRGRGLDLRTDTIEKIHHNKYAILDGRLTITGSMNWSDNGENRNSENTVFIDNPLVAKQFTADFEFHWNHSIHYLLKPRPVSASTSNPRRPFFSSRLPHSQEFLSWHALLAPSCQ